MEFTSEVKKATNSIYQKISKTMPEIEWSVHSPYIYEINKLKKKNPGVPVVSYVNTSAEVKAETDVCCTSKEKIQVFQ